MLALAALSRREISWKVRVIEIDGAYGERGGAILRQAVGLAAYAGRAVRVSRIRAHIQE